MEEMMKSIQGEGLYGRVSYKDLCLFFGVSRPPKFKMPEFEKYDGTGNPVVHFRLYIGKMEEYIEHEKFVIRTFQESLRGSALIWFASLGAEDISTWKELANRFCQTILVQPGYGSKPDGPTQHGDVGRSVL